MDSIDGIVATTGAENMEAAAEDEVLILVAEDTSLLQVDHQAMHCVGDKKGGSVIGIFQRK